MAKFMTMNPEPLEFLTERQWAVIRECFGRDVDKTVESRSRWESLIWKLGEHSKISELKDEISNLKTELDDVYRKLSEADEKIMNLEEGESR